MGSGRAGGRPGSALEELEASQPVFVFLFLQALEGMEEAMGKVHVCLEPPDRMLARAEPQFADGSFSCSHEGLPWPLRDASEVCCPCAGYACSAGSEVPGGAAVTCQHPLVGAGHGCSQVPAPPAAVPGGGWQRQAGSGSCRRRSGSSSDSSSG